MKRKEIFQLLLCITDIEHCPLNWRNALKPEKCLLMNQPVLIYCTLKINAFLRSYLSKIGIIGKLYNEIFLGYN